METAGATKAFSLSKERHRLYYTSFYRDSDSKAYPAAKEIYSPNKPIKRFECVGHYQKRVGSMLHNLKKKHKKTGRKENSLIQN